MQPCRGGGCAAFCAGVHRLIALRVGQRGVDIGWKGRLPGSPDDLLVGEAYQPRPAARVLQYLSFHAIHLKPGPRPKASPRLDQGLPHARARAMQQQDLHRSACAQPSTPQPSGDHSAVVEYQQVSRPEKPAYLIEAAMLKLAGFAAHNHEARVVARLDGGLGYEVTRQVVVEVAGSHGVSLGRGGMQGSGEWSVLR